MECFCLGLLLTFEFPVLDVPWGHYPPKETFYVETGFILKAGGTLEGRTDVSEPLLMASPERARLPEPFWTTRESALCLSTHL